MEDHPVEKASFEEVAQDPLGIELGGRLDEGHRCSHDATRT